MVFTPKYFGNCFGKLARDNGHMRVPDTPHRMTGTMGVGVSITIGVDESTYYPIDALLAPYCQGFHQSLDRAVVHQSRSGVLLWVYAFNFDHRLI